MNNPRPVPSGLLLFISDSSLISGKRPAPLSSISITQKFSLSFSLTTINGLLHLISWSDSIEFFMTLIRAICNCTESPLMIALESAIESICSLLIQLRLPGLFEMMYRRLLWTTCFKSSSESSVWALRRSARTLSVIKTILSDWELMVESWFLRSDKFGLLMLLSRVLIRVWDVSFRMLRGWLISWAIDPASRLVFNFLLIKASSRSSFSCLSLKSSIICLSLFLRFWVRLLNAVTIAEMAWWRSLNSLAPSLWSSQLKLRDSVCLVVSVIWSSVRLLAVVKAPRGVSKVLIKRRLIAKAMRRAVMLIRIISSKFRSATLTSWFVDVPVTKNQLRPNSRPQGVALKTKCCEFRLGILTSSCLNLFSFTRSFPSCCEKYFLESDFARGDSSSWILARWIVSPERTSTIWGFELATTFPSFSTINARPDWPFHASRSQLLSLSMIISTPTTPMSFASWLKIGAL